MGNTQNILSVQNDLRRSPRPTPQPPFDLFLCGDLKENAEYHAAKEEQSHSEGRITEINDNGGEFKKGLIKAELDIKDDLWFFDCHFREDPVMPGCLGLDAMWQLVGFFLGWTGEPGKGRALGVNSVKFTGEVLKTVKMATYEINIKRIS